MEMVPVLSVNLTRDYRQMNSCAAGGDLADVSGRGGVIAKKGLFASVKDAAVAVVVFLLFPLFFGVLLIVALLLLLVFCVISKILFGSSGWHDRVDGVVCHDHAVLRSSGKWK
jgi:hypothetical protein